MKELLPAASSAHPIKELPGHGGVSSWQGWHPPAPSPPRRLPTSCCQNFASPSSPSSPSGSRNETRGHPSPGREQIPGPRGRDRSPAWARPRGSWKGGGDGAETPGEGDGDRDKTSALVAQRVPACGRCSEAGTPPELPLPVRCSDPGANGGRRVPASSSSAGPAGTGNGRDRESKSMRGQRMFHHFTRSGRCQSFLGPPTDPFLGGKEIAQDWLCPARLSVPIFPFCSTQVPHPHILIPAVIRFNVPISPSPPLPCQIQHSHSQIPFLPSPSLQPPRPF